MKTDKANIRNSLKILKIIFSTILMIGTSFAKVECKEIIPILKWKVNIMSGIPTTFVSAITTFNNNSGMDQRVANAKALDKPIEQHGLFGNGPICGWNTDYAPADNAPIKLGAEGLMELEKASMQGFKDHIKDHYEKLLGTNSTSGGGSNQPNRPTLPKGMPQSGGSIDNINKTNQATNNKLNKVLDLIKQIAEALNGQKAQKEGGMKADNNNQADAAQMYKLIGQIFDSIGKMVEATDSKQATAAPAKWTATDSKSAAPSSGGSDSSSSVNGGGGVTDSVSKDAKVGSAKTETDQKASLVDQAKSTATNATNATNSSSVDQDKVKSAVAEILKTLSQILDLFAKMMNGGGNAQTFNQQPAPAGVNTNPFQAQQSFRISA